MTRNQAPQARSLHQRDGHRGADVHVLQIAQISRLGAAQPAEAQIQRLVRQTRQAQQRNRLVLDIADDPQVVGQVEAARWPGDVRGRVVQAQQGLEVGFALLRDHLAVPVLVEAVDHDPVVPGQMLDLGGERGVQPGRAVSRLQNLGRVADVGEQRHHRHRLGGVVRLQFQYQQAVRPEPRHLVGRRPPDRPEHLRIESGRTGVHEAVAQPSDRHLAEHQRQGGTDGLLGRDAQVPLAIGTGPQHDQVGLPNGQQDAVGLDRVGQVDGLTVAVGQFGRL